jgi:hypothetical protein
MNSDTIYKEGNHDDFITYLFSNSPKDKGEVKLELPLNEPGKNLGLHEFEQLLMIFVDGLKYFYGENGKVDINKLTEEDIKRVNDYFISMNYEVVLEVFPTLHEYRFKHPNYFKDQKYINEETTLVDFYYEIYGHKNCAFRISFINLLV